MVKSIHALIIGDEILSGKREDKHLSYLIKKLNENNLLLNSASYVGDNSNDIVKKIQENKDKIVFAFGGIGATPDDKTRQAAATANDIKLVKHSEAVVLIENQFEIEVR